MERNGRLPEQIRASVSADSVERVSRFFDASLGQTLDELFQNARRAGATRIDVDVDADGRLRVADDGSGIEDPRVVLCFGQSDWKTPAARNEDPAGMGLYALARTRTTIRSRPRAGRAWEVELGPEHWEGRETAAVTAIDAGDGSGTEVRFEPPGDDGRGVSPPGTDDVDGRRQWARTAVETAARYLPVTVTYAGKACRQEDFLQDAVRVTRWEGIRIGVYRHNRSGAGPVPGGLIDGRPINFHGMRAAAPLPHVEGLYHWLWTARVDVVERSGLELTLPQRASVVRNAYAGELERKVEEALYETIRDDPGAWVRAHTARRALEMGIRIAPPAPRLRRFCPPPDRMEESWERWVRPDGNAEDDVPEGAFLVVADNPTAQVVSRALQQAGADDRAFEEDRRLAGYDWYDRLPRLGVSETRIRMGGEKLTIREEGQSDTVGDGRPETIEIELVDESGRIDGAVMTLAADIAFGDPEADDPDEVGLLLREGADVSAEEAADLATRAYWKPRDEINDWQREEWAERMRWHARQLVTSPEDADRQAVGAAFDEHVRDAVPDADEITIRYRKGAPLEVSVRRG